MIYYHRLKSNNPRQIYKTDYFISPKHILHTPYKADQEEKYREYFYRQLHTNKDFREAAHDICWIYVNYNRVDIHAVNVSDDCCWLNVIKEYVFNKYKEYLKREKGKSLLWIEV